MCVCVEKLCVERVGFGGGVGRSDDVDERKELVVACLHNQPRTLRTGTPRAGRGQGRAQAAGQYRGAFSLSRTRWLP